MCRVFLLLYFTIAYSFILLSQTPKEQYDAFKQETRAAYLNFRNECNQKYIDFLRQSWDWYEGKAPLPVPVELTPVPPRPYDEKEQPAPIEATPTPVDVEPVAPEPQPKPVEPVKEVPTPKDDYFAFDFYGVGSKVRLPEAAKLRLKDCSNTSIADGWERLCIDGMNNAIRDCLEARIRYNLCDWAYLRFLDELSRQYCADANGATLLMAFLYCQSGYQMRLAVDGGKLCMLYGSKHQIFDKGYFVVDGISFYPYGESSNSISICAAVFEGETPMSLLVDSEQKLGSTLSENRVIGSKRYPELTVGSSVPTHLIDFYNSYPSSAIDGNPMTRWAMYANTPLAEATRNKLYPELRKAFEGKSKLQKVEMLLNWVQTGFVYEYDDKVWGGDRAFFAEESLYYPYCDCEDRSILFSRLVRDLLGLDVALIYYPGHLATAVCFGDDTKGDAMMIGDKRYTVCDPTYIGAPIGAQMPGLEYDKTQAIVLRR